MKFTQFNILILFLSFQIILNRTEITTNYGIIEIPTGKTRYSYNVTLPSTQENKTPFIFMKFSDDIEFGDIDENTGEDVLSPILADEWITLDLLGFPQDQLLFTILNNNNDNVKMTFIDYSKEINLDLKGFLNWNYNINFTTEILPTPIIFNVDTIKETTSFSLSQDIFQDQIVDDTNLLYYCLNNGDDCTFTKLENLTVEKGNKYKFKLNPIVLEDDDGDPIFYFIPIPFSSKQIHIEEIKFGKTIFEIDENKDELYFIANIKEYSTFFTFVKHNVDLYNIAIITEEQKENIEEELEYIQFDNAPTTYVLDFHFKNDDYLLFKIKYGNEPYTGIIYLVNEEFVLKEGNNYEIEKGNFAILTKSKELEYNYILASTSYNMELIDSHPYEEAPTNLYFFNEKLDANQFVFIDSTNKNTKIKFSNYSKPYDEYKFNIVNKNDVNNVFNEYGPDSIFMRASSHSIDFGFNSTLIFGIDEQYYLYAKKIFGNVNVYQLNEKLDLFSDFEKLKKPFENYELDKYSLVTNNIKNVSGFQLFSFYNTYGSLYDIFMQKVDDSENVQINEKMFKFKNFVKLFNKDKTYNLNFNVDHYIKLDNSTLNAEVTFTSNEKTYKLNSEIRVIKDLSGDNIVVNSNENALVYFYKKINKDSQIKIIEFDKKEKGKALEIEIKALNEKNLNIILIKDIGFKECYPMLSERSWNNLNLPNNSMTISIENLYDKLEYDLYDLYEDYGEAFYIYIFDSFDDNNFPIFNPQNYEINELFYVDNLNTIGNKFNFEIIPENSEKSKNISIINSINKPLITYQFITCEKDNIEFFFYNGYKTYSKSINQNLSYDQELANSEILIHSFNSKKEFLFGYNLHNTNEMSTPEFNENYSIFSINKFANNTLEIIFIPAYYNSLTQYSIIVAKKDSLNNAESFSNPCHLGKLLTHNSENIIVKSFFHYSDTTKLTKIIDVADLISGITNELVISVVSNNMNYSPFLTFYTAKEYQYEIYEEILTFNFGEKTKFDFDKKSIFKFDYTIKSNNDKLKLQIEAKIGINIGFSDGNNKETYKYLPEEKLLKIPLSKSGKFYLSFSKLNEDEDDNDLSFIADIENKLIEVIDLSKDKYYNKEQIKEKIKNDPNFYNVQNLKEDKLVIFNYQIISSEGEEINYNPFKICNDITEDCEEDKITYKFLKQYNYTIYIKYVYYEDSFEKTYYYPAYVITPFNDDGFEKVTEGYHILKAQKILFVNLENKRDLYLKCENVKNTYYAYTDEEIKINNFDILTFNDFSDEVEKLSNPEGKKYVIILPIEKINGRSSNVIIFNILFEKDEDTYTIPSEKNAFIFIEEENESEEEILEDKNPLLDSYNTLKFYSSPEENLQIATNIETLDLKNITLGNFIKMPIYIEKNGKNKDIEINLKKYEPRFTFFAAINDDYFNAYKNLWESGISDPNRPQKEFGNLFPLVTRLNTDLNTFYDYMNFYLSGIKEKVNIYIKKLYGGTEFYECGADPIDKMDFSILTKPISSCKNKKSIFNRFIKLDDTKIITGYFDYNSYFEIYLDLDDDNKNIKVSDLLSEYEIINTGKYLKKGVEYNINLNESYMVKLDPEFDSKIEITDEKGNIKLTLSPESPTGKLEKEKYIIKANNDNAMVYFYGKIKDGFKAEKIENIKGKNVEIKMNYDSEYLIDFGFEGYAPSNIFMLNNKDIDGKGLFITVFLENMYEKLKTKLVGDESLYLYYKSSRDVEIKYTDENLNNAKNEYTFNVIPKNEDETNQRSLIINNLNLDKIKYQVYYCNEANDITLYYQDKSDPNEYSLSFNENDKIIDADITRGANKLRFKSNEDFIFSYSFIDEADERIINYNKWNMERKELNDLSINEITLDNEIDKIYSIKFNSNYKNSSTRYILIAAKSDDNNSIENFSNPCYITRLVTEKADGVKIINIYDIGENDEIKVNVDFSDVIDLQSTNYILTIISQELRFEKKINYYKPKTFTFSLNPEKIDMDKTQEFNFDNKKVYFELQVDKKSNKNEMLLLNYKLEESTPLNIQISGPNGNQKIFNVNKEEGFLNFLCDESGPYRIYFKKAETKYLRNLEESISNVKGSFRMLSTESPFKLDITKNNIEFDEFNITGTEPPILQFTVESLEKDYIKKISIANVELNKNSKIVSVNKKNEGFKDLNFKYYTFEKGENYIVNINFNKKEENKYTLEKVNILDFPKYNIQNLKSGDMEFIDTSDKFLVIDWSKIKTISIIIENNNPVFFLSKLTKSQSTNLDKNFQNLDFKPLDTLKISKEKNIDYSVLLVELSEEGTVINFDFEEEEGSNKEEGNKKSNKGIPVVYIILIAIGGLIILTIIIFLIIRKLKKKQDIDFNNKAEEITQQKLLNEI